MHLHLALGHPVGGALWAAAPLRARVVANVQDLSTSPKLDDLQSRRARLLSELADVDRALEAEKAQSANADDLPIALGSRTSAFEPSFGYLSRSAGVYTEAVSEGGANLPSSALDLAVKNFQRELQELVKALKGEASESFAPEAECAAQAREVRSKLDALVLSNDAVWQREREREASGGKVDSPLLLLGPYYFLCWCLDAFFEDRPLARFWFLETVRSLRARLACVWSSRALCLA